MRKNVRYQILWDPSVSAFNLNEKAFAAVGERRSGAFKCAHPCVHIDSIYSKHNWDDSYESMTAMIAIGVKRRRASKEYWCDFLSWLPRA